MKHINLSIVFAMLLLILFTIVNQRIQSVVTISNLQIHYNTAIDNAVEDTLMQAVDMDSSEYHTIDFAKVTTTFLHYFSWNMGLEANSMKGRLLSNYIPVITYVTQDGYYIAHHSEVDLLSESGECKEESAYNSNRNWNPSEWNEWTENSQITVSDKKLFYEEYHNYTIQYTLNDYVRITDKITGEVTEGMYQDVSLVLPGILPEEASLFERERRRVVIDCISTSMNEYITNYNQIAEQYGIQYQFTLPTIEKEDWYRTIDDISMIVLFQGYPYGNHIIGQYNRVALGGARLRKK